MKTKKTKLFVFLAVLLFLVTPIFSGCDVNIKLNKPAFVNYQINQSTGEQILITDNNIYAKEHGGWIFGISTVYENEDTSNFFTYRSDTPYFYVTDIFKNAQTYYFYSQAIGGGEYVTSEKSDVNSVTIQYKLDTPVLALNGTSLSWTAVQNAKTYIIYANDVVVTETTSNSYDVADYVANQNGNEPFVFEVACKQNNNYLKSAKSNQVLYTDHLVLSTPINLRINNGSNKMLAWNGVSGCNQYKVVVNNTDEHIVYSNKFNLTEYYNQHGVGTYAFKVMAVGEGYFKSSGYSEPLTDVCTQQLGTPQNLNSAVGIDYIKLTWSVIDNASEYAIYLNGERFYLNQSTGVNSPVVTNSVIIKNADLLSYNLSYLSYQIQAIAQDGGYYTNSSMSGAQFVNIDLSVLPSPVVSVDAGSHQILINSVAKAQLYQVDYTFNGEPKDAIFLNASVADVISLDYKAQFVDVGKYTLKVKAIAEHEVLNSPYSNEVAFEIYPPVTTLQAPNVSQIYVSGDYLYVDFDVVDQNSKTFSLYINDKLVAPGLQQGYSFVNLNDIFAVIEPANYLEAYLVANSTDEWHLASKKSNAVKMSTVLDDPTNISLNGATLSWSPVKNAQNYCLVLDNDIIKLNSNATSVNVANYIATNKARQVKLFAHTDYFTDSNAVGNYIYNNTSAVHNGYTNKYFFYGETYDYYITSQEELNDLFRYAVSNFIEDVSCYINYNTNLSNGDKLDITMDSLAIGTYGFSYGITGGSSNSGKLSVSFSYYPISTCTPHNPDYPQFSKTYQHKSQTGRSDLYNDFASENWYVTQDVYTSDGLVAAVENKAVPRFVSGSSKAQEIYNKAKQILRRICDDSMTDYEKAVAIHDYVVLNTSYDYTGLENEVDGYIGYYHYLEGFFDYGLTVCDGYAKTYSLLCNMEGIQTIRISGDAGGGHAWNKTYIDADGNGTKEWYTIDCTWDDSANYINSQRYELLSHDYFMIPDSYMPDRTEDIDYQPSVTTGGTYYDTFKLGGNSLKIETQAQLDSLLNYLKANSIIGVEILLSSSVSLWSLSGYSYTSYGYEFIGGYKQVYLYK